MNSLVSVIVPTRNAGRTLRACLESVRAQTYAPIESVVVDNESRDATLAIARELADVVMAAGPERSAQRNAGLRAAQGDYVLFVDADMRLEPDVVGECVKALHGRGGVAIPEESFGRGFWAEVKAFERSCYTDDLLIISAARFFRKADLLAAGGYDEQLHGGEDWDVSMRICGDAGPAFARALIRHDEGDQNLQTLWLKKFYYGRSLPAFIRKHGRAALARLSPVRTSLVRNAPRLLRAPALATGLLVMKSVEAGGGLLGMLVGSLTPGAGHGDRRA